MRSPARTLRAVLVLLTALVTVLVGLGSAPAAQAAPVAKQRVFGAINCPRAASCPSIKMQWFDQNWTYLGSQRANGGGYSLKLPAGSYHLQFVDQRPSYDTSKYAPTDVAVTVGSHSVVKNVTMRPGASFTGVAKAGGKRLAGARIVAANRSEQSFTTTANDKGQFAVGGLPAGKYCLFTYDRAKRYVDKCTWAGGVDFGQSKNKKIKLKKRAGSLTVFIDTATGGSAPSSNVTVTSKATGQWWTAKLRKGKAVFKGLYPSRYNYKYDGGGIWLAATGSVRGGDVRSDKMSFGDVRLTKRGAWITGSLLDGGPDGTGTGFALTPPYTGAKGATVTLYSAYGQPLATGYSDKNGNFKLQGQLTSQSDLTVVVEPTPSSGGYMIGEGYCLFKRKKYSADPDTAAPITIVTGKETFLTDLPVPRAADQENPECATA